MKKSDDKMAVQETEDDVLRRLLKTPPKEHTDMKYPRLAKRKRIPGGKRGRPKKVDATTSSTEGGAS